MGSTNGCFGSGTGEISTCVLDVTALMISSGTIFHLDFSSMPELPLYLKGSWELGVTLLLEVSPVSYFLFSSPYDMGEIKIFPE